MTTARWITADVFNGLDQLPDQSVDLIMSSPPFWGLRTYLPKGHPDKEYEIGSELSPGEFLDTLLNVVEACERVLTPHGSLCFEIGDTYSGSGGSGGLHTDETVEAGSGKYRANTRKGRVVDHNSGRRNPGPGSPQAKSLCFIPQLFGASLSYGRNLLNPEHDVDPWLVRNFVAWVRPNPPVGSLSDKVRPATSYLTWACKSPDRYFDLDAVRQPPSENTHARVAKGSKGRTDLPSGYRGGNWHTLEANNARNPLGSPPLDWWKIVPGGYTGAHHAVYPAEVCRIPIEASCPRRVCLSCGVPSRRLNPSGAVLDADQPSDGGPVELLADLTVGTVEDIAPSWSTCGCPGTDGLRSDGFHTGSGWRPGVVLDPFAGSGTTLLAATGLSREAIGIDLDARNLDLALERLGMFLQVAS